LAGRRQCAPVGRRNKGASGDARGAGVGRRELLRIAVPLGIAFERRQHVDVLGAEFRVLDLGLDLLDAALQVERDGARHRLLEGDRTRRRIGDVVERREIGCRAHCPRLAVERLRLERAAREQHAQSRRQKRCPSEFADGTRHHITYAPSDG
jgi:hypothetical protein